MYIYNSLTNKKEIFKTLEPNKVKMYVCGPTVYNYVHIGNARPVIFFDIVRRYLEYRGYEVTYVSNITDVDDKIINEAIKQKLNENEIASTFTKAFLEDVNRLNCIAYDVNPKVTEYMPKIINYISRLVKMNYAYEIDGDVYFKVNSIKDYGALSNQDTNNLEIGARVTENNKKENPLDFTLWKKTDVGINWESPWGTGRPGWHTECIAMINDILGELIDIHGGGSDLKFPHHENEIAQSNALNNNNIAHYWMHNGRLMIDDEKMSKSLGNYVLLKEFLDNYDYRILRLFMISTHYRQPLNYTKDNITYFKNELEKIKSSFKKLQYTLDVNNYLDIDNNINNDFCEEVVNEFNNSMEDDFNTANALSAIMKLVKEINKVIRVNKYTEDNLNYMLILHKTLKTLLNIFGIDFEINSLDNEIKEMIKRRDEARSKRDFNTADALRTKLLKKGINI